MNISKQIIFIASILSLLSMLFISYFSWNSSSEAIYSLSKGAYTQSTQALAEQLGTSVRFKKLDKIDEIVNLAIASNDSNLSHISIFLLDKSALYNSNKSAVYALQDVDYENENTLVNNGDVFNYGIPLYSGKKKRLVGYMVAEWNYAYAQYINHQLTQEQLIIGAISIVVSIAILSILLTYVLSKPLTQLNELCEELSSGQCDLNKRVIFSRKNELGRLANSINLFIEKIEQTLKPIHNGASEIASISIGLDEYLLSMRHKIDTQRDEIKTTVGFGEQTQHSVTAIIDNTNSTTASLARAVESAQKGKKKLLNALEDNRLMAEKSEHTSKAVVELNEQVQQVTDILNIIRTIAEQTNLLALNAAIEAARAGDEGRGFAVVADEVRGLAEKTSSSTNQVKVILDQFEKLSANLIQHTQLGIEASQNSLGSIEQTVDDIQTALYDVSQADEVCKLIVSSSDIQLSATSNLASQLDKIDSQIDSLTEDFAQIAASSTELNAQAIETNDFLAKYNF